MSINDATPEGYSEFKEAYETASGVVSTLGMAILMKDKPTIAGVMDDITALFIEDPVAGLDLFKVTLMMCAKTSIDLYSEMHPGWRDEIEAEINNKKKEGK